MAYEYKKLEDVVEILDNKRKPVSDKKRQNMVGEIPYYGANGQVGWINDYMLDEKLILLAEDGGNYLDPFKPNAYTIEGKAWVNNHAHVLKNKSEIIDFDWLFYVLAWSDIRNYVSGTTRLKLNQTRMREIPIPLPPLSEQKQIILKIKKCLTSLDNAERKLQHAEEKIGKVMNSSNSLFKTSNLNKEYKLSEVILLRNGKFNPSSKLRQHPDSEYKIKVYGGNGVTGYFNKTLVNNKTIIIGRVGAKCGSVHKNQEPIWVTDNALYIQTFLKEIDHDFLYWKLKSLNLNSLSDGTGQPKIDQSKLYSLTIEIPYSLDEQKQIAEKLENINKQVHKSLSSIIEMKLKFKYIRQSILKKAFEGKLI